MKTLKTVAAAAALAGLLATAGPAIAQSSGSEQHHGSQPQDTGQPQSQTQRDQNHGTPGMQVQNMQSMMEMMHRMMHGQVMMHSQAISGQGSTATGTPDDESPASLALKAVNEKMHRDMAIALSGKPDVDFAKAMIVHHQGAIDMSKVVLAFGQDPDVRRLAEEIIKAQEAEITWMKDWLQKQGQ